MPESARRTGDPWVWGGVALLLLLSTGSVALYRSAPQSTAELGTRAWLVAQPDAYSPQMARARDLLATARREAAQDNGPAALAADSAAADHALKAREAARSAAEQRQATDLWAEARLHAAALLADTGKRPWWRRDDEAALRDALRHTESVLAADTDPSLRLRADSLRLHVTRALRPGPLEWLPNRR